MDFAQVLHCSVMVLTLTLQASILILSSFVISTVLFISRAILFRRVCRNRFVNADKSTRRNDWLIYILFPWGYNQIQGINVQDSVLYFVRYIWLLRNIFLVLNINTVVTNELNYLRISFRQICMSPYFVMMLRVLDTTITLWPFMRAEDKHFDNVELKWSFVNNNTMYVVTCK